MEKKNETHLCHLHVCNLPLFQSALLLVAVCASVALLSHRWYWVLT